MPQSDSQIRQYAARHRDMKTGGIFEWWLLSRGCYCKPDDTQHKGEDKRSFHFQYRVTWPRWLARPSILTNVEVKFTLREKISKVHTAAVCQTDAPTPVHRERGPVKQLLRVCFHLELRRGSAPSPDRHNSPVLLSQELVMLISPSLMTCQPDSFASFHTVWDRKDGSRVVISARPTHFAALTLSSPNLTILLLFYRSSRRMKGVYKHSAIRSVMLNRPLFVCTYGQESLLCLGALTVCRRCETTAYCTGKILQNYQRWLRMFCTSSGWQNRRNSLCM